MKEKNTYQKNSILLFGGCGKLGKYIIENLNIEKDQSELYILDLNQPEINDNFLVLFNISFSCFDLYISIIISNSLLSLS